MPEYEIRNGGSLDKRGVTLVFDQKIKAAANWVTNVVGSRLNDYCEMEYELFNNGFDGLKVVGLIVRINDAYAFARVRRGLGQTEAKVRVPRFTYVNVEAIPDYPSGPCGGKFSITLKDEYKSDAQLERQGKRRLPQRILTV